MNSENIHGEGLGGTDNSDDAASADQSSARDLLPLEHLLIQSWTTIGYAASNAELLARHFGDDELQAVARSIMDTAADGVTNAIASIQEKAKRTNPFAPKP